MISLKMVGLIGLMVIAMGVSADEDGFEAPEGPGAVDDSPDSRDDEVKHREAEMAGGCGLSWSGSVTFYAKEAVKNAFDHYSSVVERLDSIKRAYSNEGRKVHAIFFFSSTPSLAWGVKYQCIYYQKTAVVIVQ